MAWRFRLTGATPDHVWFSKSQLWLNKIQERENNQDASRAASQVLSGRRTIRTFDDRSLAGDETATQGKAGFGIIQDNAQINRRAEAGIRVAGDF